MTANVSLHKEKWYFRASGLGLLMMLLGCYAKLALVTDFRYAVPEVLGITALATMIVAILLYGGRKGWARWSPVTIVVLAAGLRLLFLFHNPQLSDDAYRYLFDGRQSISGHNPYAASPEQAAKENRALAPLAAKVNHPHLVTIYPPGAQVVFAVGALWKNMVGIKGVLILMDLVCIVLMIRMMSHLGIGAEHAILYAWHPLPVLEIAASGHIDGVAVVLVFAALSLCRVGTGSQSVSASSGGPSGSGGAASSVSLLPPRQRGTPVTVNSGIGWRVFWGGVLFSFAILVKLFPIVFLPFCAVLVQPSQRLRFSAGLILGGLLLILPFYSDISNMLVTLRIYADRWEFSGLAFQILRQLLDSGGYARVLLSLIFIVFWLYCFAWLVRRPTPESPENGCQFLKTLRVCYSVSFVFLMVTPTLFPWYSLYMLALLPFFPNPAGMILSWTIMLGYRVLIEYFVLNQWVEAGGVSLMIWMGPITALLLSFAIYRNRSPTFIPDYCN